MPEPLLPWPAAPTPYWCRLCSKATWSAPVIVRDAAICDSCLEDIEAEIDQLQLLDPARRARPAGGPRMTSGVLIQQGPGWTAP